jgi:hypothetical protein
MLYRTRFLSAVWVAAVLATASSVGADVEPPAASDGPGSGLVTRPPRSSESDGAPLYTTEVLSPVYTVDQIFPSMKGPVSTHPVVLDPDSPSELIWMTGFQSTMMDGSGSEELSEEFMCHTNLAFSEAQRNQHHQRFPSQIQLNTGRLATLSQGQLSVRFPKGFGVPLMSDQGVLVNTQVLNHNLQDQTIQVRHKVEFEFLRDRDLEKPLKALLPIGAQGLVLVDGDDGHFGLRPDEVDPAQHGEGCGLGIPAKDNSQEVFGDERGRTFTAFWVVPPGREVRTTRATDQLNLPYDTRAHFIAVHLHPFAESLELFDRTAGETVFKSVPEQRSDQVGLARVETFSSEEGVPLYRDHEYDLISVYNNTSKVDRDAMATLLLYVQIKDLYDFDFRPRKRESAASTH